MIDSGAVPSRGSEEGRPTVDEGRGSGRNAELVYAALVAAREELERTRRERDLLVAENRRLRERLGETAAERASVASPRAFPTEPVVAPPEPIDDTAPANVKLAAFRSRFLGRDDVYALRWEDQRSGRSGYAPAVAGGWAAAKRTGRRDYLPLTDAVLERHLRGRDTVGLFPLLDDDTCWLLAADFDGAGWLLDARAFAATCDEHEVPVLIERSRSGAGAHAWIFFVEPVAAASARRMGAGLLTATMQRRGELDLGSFDRLFPSQDLLPTGGFGNLIALPLQGQARSESNSVFVDPATGDAYSDQWQTLSAVGRLSATDVERLADELTQPAAWQDFAGGTHHGAVPRHTRGRRPAPNLVTGELASGLHLQTAGWPPWLLSELKQLASLHNPEFYQRQRRRQSTHDTPRIIRCYGQDLTHLHVPRGLVEDVHERLGDAGARLDLTDTRPPADTLELEFRGELSALQADALTAVVGHELGTLVAPPGTGKTVIGCAAIAARATPTLVLVHLAPLVEQWRRQLIEQLGLSDDEVGTIGGGRDHPSGIVDVAMLQSLARRDDLPELFARYPHLVVDECHHIPAQSFERVVRAAPARFVLGLTATPYRRDGLEGMIAMQCGPVRHTITVDDALTDHGLSLDLRVHDTELTLDADGMAIHQVFAALVADEARTNLICRDVAEAVDRGRRCLVLSQRKDHLAALAEGLRERGHDPLVLQGGLGVRAKREVQERLQSLPTDAGCLVLATGQYVGEGFDCPPLDTLFLTFPMSFKGSIVQYVGRLLRPAAGKDEVIVHDYVDRDVPMLASMFGKRRAGYRKLGLASRAHR